ncbi:MAG: DUF692 domain-containing protein [Alphaproteobacteria bacterium]
MTLNSPPPRGVRSTVGIGLRAPHCDEVMATRPAVGWLEVHSENYMGGGAPVRMLEDVRREWPISLHGVGLSLGSAEGLSASHLARLAGLVDRIEPALVSEHLSWSVAGGTYLNDLLPLPYTEETLATVARNVEVMQDWLKRQVLIENPSAYLRFVHTSIPEAEFLAELVRKTGCGLLCDVNNIHVSCTNNGGDPRTYLHALPAHAVQEIHLAGFATNEADGVPILIDDHGSAVADAVWALYDVAVALFPTAATLIEWDSNLPPLATLVGEAATARLRRQAALARHDGGHHVAAA